MVSILEHIKIYRYVNYTELNPRGVLEYNEDII